jgi:hypothetical protein
MMRFTIALLLCIVLSACGDDGSSSTSTPSGPTPEQVAAAQSAKLTATYNTANNQATLNWSDTFPAATSYSIQQQASDGSWSSLDAVPGTTGKGAPLTWTRTINAAATLRVAVLETGYSVPLDTQSGNTSLTVAPPATMPTITLSQQQPVTGNVTLSIAGGGTYSEVQWFADLNSIGTSITGPGYSIGLNAGSLTAGSHLILAQLENSPDSYLQVRLTIQVQNPEVTINASVTGTSGTVYLYVLATSAYGIVSVSATLDGNSLGTLTAPNCPSLVPSCMYQFPINATQAGSGTHTVSVVAVDGNGVSATQTFQVTFIDPPSLAVTTPFDGALVNGTLAIAGTFSTDRQAVTVSVTATLGSVTILNATSSPFSASYSLAGVTPGTYTLTVIATDSTGLTTTVTDAVTVTSSPSLVYKPVLTLGANGSILAVSSCNILYQDSSGKFHVFTPSSDTVISLGTLSIPEIWAITDAGYVFAEAFGTDRPSASVSIYMWAPGKTTPTNLSIAAGSKSQFDQLLPVHFPWVLWASQGPSTLAWSQFTLYNVTTGQNITVPEPAGTAFVGNDDCDFAIINGKLRLFFWAGQNTTTNIYSWSQATGATTQLTSDGLSLFPQTDGTTVAWQTDQGPLPPNPPFTLSTENIASGDTGTLSADMQSFQLNAGVFGWIEQTFVTSSTGNPVVTAQTIKASNGTAITTLANLLSSVFFGSSGGYVAYEQSAQLYDWSPAGGSVVLFNAAPGQARLAGSTIYFTNGASQAVYAVTMH